MNVESFDGSESSVTYDADREERPSTAVVNAVAEAVGRDPTELPPLQRTIDADALDEMFGETLGGRPRTSGSVTFEYCGCSVVVLADGEVVVRESDDHRPTR